MTYHRRETSGKLPLSGGTHTLVFLRPQSNRTDSARELLLPRLLRFKSCLSTPLHSVALPLLLPFFFHTSFSPNLPSHVFFCIDNSRRELHQISYAFASFGHTLLVQVREAQEEVGRVGLLYGDCAKDETQRKKHPSFPNSSSLLKLEESGFSLDGSGL